MTDSRKALGGIVLVVILVFSMNTVIDEVTAIAEDASATRFDIMLGNVFPPLYVVMTLSVCGAVVYWVWRGFK